MINSKNLYSAGGIFSNKDLIGNMFLAESLHRVSNQKYKCVMPQNLEQTSANPETIKNNDMHSIMQSPGAIFAFDGGDLDSGTVAEFMVAKFLDKPTVIYRTDFRNGGDNEKKGGDPWNLMLSNYPRTKVVMFEQLIPKYQKILQSHKKSSDIAEQLSDLIAIDIVDALDEVFDMSALKLPIGMTERIKNQWFNIACGTKKD